MDGEKDGILAYEGGHDQQYGLHYCHRSDEDPEEIVEHEPGGLRNILLLADDLEGGPRPSPVHFLSPLGCLLQSQVDASLLLKIYD